MIQSLYITSDRILHGADITENGIRSDIFRIDHTSEIQVVNNILVRQAVDLGNQLGVGKFLGRK